MKVIATALSQRVRNRLRADERVLPEGHPLLPWILSLGDDEVVLREATDGPTETAPPSDADIRVKLMHETTAKM